MSNIELHFDSPWLLLIVIPALAAVLVPWLLIPAQRRSGFRKTAPVVLHAVLSVVLVLVIAGITLSYSPRTDDTDAGGETEESADAKKDGGLLIIADKVSKAESIVPLLPEGTAVKISSPRQAAMDIAVLSSYDKIMLCGVSANDLPDRLAGQLSMYVQQGGSLLISGSDHSLSLGNMRGTAYETLLPVSFDYTSREGQSIALMLVLDCSNSMSGNGGYWGGGYTDFLSMAKQGAIRSIESLKENDIIGIVSFNRRATLRSEPVSATETQKAVLNRIISGLSTSRGTYYCDALTMAWEQLEDIEADVRHVIFLSDGEPSDYGYDDIVEDMAREGITVSTISLGYSSYVLSDMAQEGNGRYYEVTSIKDLPEIMLGETETAVSDPLVDEETDVTLPGGVPTDLPAVSAYIGTTLKEGAEMVLQTENKDPIFARWEIGGGEADVFTSDILGAWTAEWKETNPGRSMLRQIFASGIREKPDDDSMIAEEEIKTDKKAADFLIPLSVILVLFMLADIAIRRLRWKDILILFKKA